MKMRRRRMIISSREMLLLSLLLVVLVFLPAAQAKKLKLDVDGKFSILAAFRYFSGYDDGEEEEQVEPQKIMLIGAGHGRTGTSSLVQALKQLGLKSYHMKEGVFETPGHLDLWYRFYVEQSITIDDVMDRIAQDGFNATADAPINFHFEALMKRFPEARVILTLRKGGAESWVQSLYESVMLFHPILKRPPFKWMAKARKQSAFFAAMNRQMNVPEDPVTHLPDRSFMAAEYDRWTEHVKATVPEDKLLTFYAEDGWEPLCRFLSPLSPEVEHNCQKVLESGEPYPYVNDKGMIQKVVFTMNLICYVCEMAPYLIVAFLLIKFFRPIRRKAEKSKTH